MNKTYYLSDWDSIISYNFTPILFLLFKLSKQEVKYVHFNKLTTKKDNFFSCCGKDFQGII